MKTTRGFATKAASDLYRDTVTNRHGIATMGFLNHLAAALLEIEREALALADSRDPEWTTDSAGYVRAPLVNRGTLDG